MNTKNNQRYHSTDVRMKAAMLRLMTHVPFERITVKQICETAGVNRSTFYFHYPDLSSMLDEMEDHLSEKLMEFTSTWDLTAIEASPGIFIPYLQFMKEHRYFYRVTLANRNALPIKKSFLPLWEHITALRQEKGETDEDSHLIYFFIYFQAGITMVLKHWLETDCETSETEMAKLLAQCIPKSRFAPQ